MVETRKKNRQCAGGKGDVSQAEKVRAQGCPARSTPGQGDASSHQKQTVVNEDNASDVQSDELNIKDSPHRATRQAVVTPPPEHVPHPDGTCARCRAKCTPCCGVSGHPCLSCKKAKVRCDRPRTNRKRHERPSPLQDVPPHRPGERLRNQPGRAVKYQPHSPSISNAPGELKGRRRMSDTEIVRFLEDSAITLVHYAEVCMRAANSFRH